MNDLGITIGELSNSRMMIHGVNLEGQRAIGMIRLELTMGDLTTSLSCDRLQDVIQVIIWTSLVT